MNAAAIEEKKENKYTIVLNKTAISLWIILFGIFVPNILPNNVQNVMQVTILIYGFIFLLYNLGFSKMLNISLIFVVPVIFSCWINYQYNNISLTKLLGGFTYALSVYELYTIITYSIYKDKEKVLIDTIYAISNFYCFMSIVLILLMRNSNAYFIGTKFMTSYLFLFNLGIKYFKEKISLDQKVYKKKNLFLQILLYGILVYYIDCMTGFVCILLFAVLMSVNKNTQKFFFSPYIITLMLAASLLFLFVFDAILSIEQVQALIINVLHRRTHLSHRTYIYERIINIFISGNIYYGYGYSSNLLRSAIGYSSNIQNGLFQILLSYGLFGAIGIIILVFYCTLYGRKKNTQNWPICVVVICLIFAATIEISLNKFFLLSLFLIRWLGNEYIQK